LDGRQLTGKLKEF
jgi:hypothetical protein